MPAPAFLSPVLLLGAGAGEATCGILYLASYLRRHGIEASVRLFDEGEDDDDALLASLEGLLARVRPRLVGISLKWFHHLARARRLAEAVRHLDPSVRIVLGGNTASWFWRELSAWDCVDDIVLGDGEGPLLALCRGEPSPPNCVTRHADGTASRPALTYVQGAGAASRDVHYSHFDELFLSELDRSSFSGWVAPGKGCADTCLYCGGGRGVQVASFGRARPFLRDEASVRRDHREILSSVWQLRYDFSGGTAAFMARAWAGLDLSGHATTYFLWGVPSQALLDALARTFRRVFLVLDVGCFSETQRLELIGRGLLKPCPTDVELLDAVARCRAHANLELEVCGILGLPFTSAASLEQERRLIERLLALGCVVGAQRLEAQPGALVTEHAGRFGMVAEARSFDELFDWFSPQPALEASFPLVRFGDRALEKAVDRHAARLGEQLHRQAVAKTRVTGRTSLVTSVAATRQLELGAWLGSHRVPARFAREPVTVLRSADGAGLACAPALDARRFVDPAIEQGPSATAILSALDAFKRPTTVDAATARLAASTRLDRDDARGLVEQLAQSRFLQPG